MQKTRVRRAGALLVGLALVAAACGDDDDDAPAAATTEAAPDRDGRSCRRHAAPAATELPAATEAPATTEATGDRGSEAPRPLPAVAASSRA